MSWKRAVLYMVSLTALVFASVPGLSALLTGVQLELGSPWYQPVSLYLFAGTWALLWEDLGVSKERHRQAVVSTQEGPISVTIRKFEPGDVVRLVFRSDWIGVVTSEEYALRKTAGGWRPTGRYLVEPLTGPGTVQTYHETELMLVEGRSQGGDA